MGVEQNKITNIKTKKLVRLEPLIKDEAYMNILQTLLQVI